jgi:hypothetical protein
MLILFDHGTPRGIARALQNHTVKQAKEQGWDRLSNGELLTAAENAGFDVLLTTDQGIAYQQNLMNRKIAVVILASARWPLIKTMLPRVIAALEAARPGNFFVVEIAD